jgi:hypothetical protein
VCFCLMEVFARVSSICTLNHHHHVLRGQSTGCLGGPSKLGPSSKALKVQDSFSNKFFKGKPYIVLLTNWPEWTPSYKCTIRDDVWWMKK